MSGSLTSVLLAGGGTAGHVSPLLALADCLRRDDPEVGITVLGTREGLEARLVPERGYPLAFVPKVPLPRRPSADLLRLPVALKRAVDAARDAIRDTGAEVLVGFGGYVSTPAYLAARRLGVPVVIHEQNTTPGLANRLGARFATAVATTFASTRLPGAQLVGMPLRHEIATLDRGAHGAEARAHFGLEDGLPTVLVTGGSLGALRLNSAFSERVTVLSAAGVQVLHVTGRGKLFEPPVTTGAPYRVVEYVDRMDLAYSAADLVVGRSGAGTVCELAAVGLPAVYVPLPIGNGEQRLNAADVVRAGGGILVEDRDLTPAWIDATLVPLATDHDRLVAMGSAAAAHGVRDADERLAELVRAAATGRRDGGRGA